LFFNRFFTIQYWHHILKKDTGTVALACLTIVQLFKGITMGIHFLMGFEKKGVH